MKRTPILILMFVATGLLAAASMEIPANVEVTGDLTIGGANHLQINGSVANDCISNAFSNHLFYDTDCDDVQDVGEDDLSVDDSGTTYLAGRSITDTAGTFDADAELYEKTKCINVDPSHTTTNWLFFRSERAITVTGIDCIVDAATSVAMTLNECNSNAGSCGATEAAITCAATNTTEASSIDDAAVDAGDWMRVSIGTVTGAPTQAELCVTYTVAD